MAPHSSTLAWKMPWMEEPGGLQSMGSLRVRHDWATHFHFSLLCIGEGNGNRLQCSCLENPRDGGAGWAAVYGVAQSRTRLKLLGSSSSIWIDRLSKPDCDPRSFEGMNETNSAGTSAFACTQTELSHLHPWFSHLQARIGTIPPALLCLHLQREDCGPSQSP